MKKLRPRWRLAARAAVKLLILRVCRPFVLWALPGGTDSGPTYPTSYRDRYDYGIVVVRASLDAWLSPVLYETGDVRDGHVLEVKGDLVHYDGGRVSHELLRLYDFLEVRLREATDLYEKLETVRQRKVRHED